MANKRIKDLPPDALPNKNDILAVDRGTTRGVTIENAVKVGRPFASQSQAEAGTDFTTAMNPLTTAQAIAAQGGAAFASAAQGSLADSAVQPDDLAAVATTGSYDDLEDKPPFDAGEFNTVSALIADETLSYTAGTGLTEVRPGSVVGGGGFRYEVAADDATDAHVETAGGVKLYLVSETVTMEALGAAADGVTDDAAVFALALKLANVSGKFLGAAGATYRVASDVTFYRNDSSALDVDLNGATLVLDAHSLAIKNTDDKIETEVSADVAAGAEYIPLASTDGVEPGNHILIESPAIFQASVATNHAYLVREVVEGGVKIVGATVADITAQQVVDSGKTGDIKATIQRLASGLKLRNGRIKVVNGGDLGQGGTYITGQFAPVVENMMCEGNSRYHLYIIGGSHDTVRNCTSINAGWLGPNGELVWDGAPSGNGYGYGIAHMNNYKSTVENCKGHFCANLTDAARGQMIIDYVNCIGFSCYTAFGTHESSWHVNLTNCHQVGTGKLANVVRAAYPKLINCSADAVTRCLEASRSNVLLYVDGLLSRTVHAWDVSANHIFMEASEAATAPGATSAKIEKRHSIRNSLFVGGGAITIGSGLGGVIEFEGNTFHGGAYVSSILAGRLTSIGRNRLYAYGSQFGIAVVLNANTTNVDIFDCVNIGEPRFATNSALLNINIDTSAEINIDRCFSRGTQYLLLRGSGQSGRLQINRMRDCEAYRLINAVSPVDIKNFVNNVYEQRRGDGDIGVSASYGTAQRNAATIATAVYDPPSIAAGAADTIQTVTLTGAALGELVEATFNKDLQGLRLNAWVSAANTVKFQFSNPTAGAIDLASGTVTLMRRLMS